MKPVSKKTFLAHQKAMQEDHHACAKVVEHFLQEIKAKESLNAFVHTYPEEAKKRAEQIDAKVAQKEGGSLAGMVVGLKDVFCYADHPLSASSGILKGFISQITSTAVQRLVDEDAILIGHQNCDEFAMGVRNKHSVYGPANHPLDPDFSPGGSSGGSAAAVAAGLCHVALGTDTGGSVRLPAAWCGIIGLKPTYGRISRYGVVEFASSFDTVSIFSHNIHDCAVTLQAIAGEDPYDNTSSRKPVPDLTKRSPWRKKAKIAYFKEAVDHPALAQDVKKNTLALMDHLQKEGHTLTSIPFPWLDYALPTYYCLTTAEASANLARYDGIRYGQRSKEAQDLASMYVKTRTQMLGFEAKRRILLGTFVLSSGYYDAYYTRAQKVRRLLKEHLEAVLQEYDFIVMPTTPTTAPRHGKVAQDAMQEYLGDLYTVLAPMAGLPAISIPNGTNEQGWPIGFQIIGKAFQEDDLLAFSQYLLDERG